MYSVIVSCEDGSYKRKKTRQSMEEQEEAIQIMASDGQVVKIYKVRIGNR